MPDYFSEELTNSSDQEFNSKEEYKIIASFKRCNDNQNTLAIAVPLYI